MVCENMFSTIFRSDPGEHVCPVWRHGARTSSRTMPREHVAEAGSRSMVREHFLACSRTMVREHVLAAVLTPCCEIFFWHLPAPLRKNMPSYTSNKLGYL